MAGNLRLAGARAAGQLAPGEIRSAALLVEVFLAPRELAAPLRPVPMLLRRVTAPGETGLGFEYRGRVVRRSGAQILLGGGDWRACLQALAEELLPAGKSGVQERLKLLAEDEGLQASLRPAVQLALLPGADRPEELYRLGRLIKTESVDRLAAEGALVRSKFWLAAAAANRKKTELKTGGAEAWVPLELKAWAEMGLRFPDGELKAAEQLKTLFKNCYREDPRGGGGYLRLGEGVNTGTAAAALLAVLALGTEADQVAVPAQRGALITFLLGQWRTDGSYVADKFAPSDEASVDADLQAGLAQWALAAAMGPVGQEGLAEKVLAGMRHYRRKFESGQLAAAAWPYHIRAAVAFYHATRRQEAADAALSMAQLLAAGQRVREEFRGRFVAHDEFGSFAPGKDEAEEGDLTVHTGLAVAALADAAALAAELGEREIGPRLRLAVQAGARYLLQVQIKDEYDLLRFAKADAPLGAFRPTPERNEPDATATAAAVMGLLAAEKLLPAAAK